MLPRPERMHNFICFMVSYGIIDPTMSVRSSGITDYYYIFVLRSDGITGPGALFALGSNRILDPAWSFVVGSRGIIDPFTGSTTMSGHEIRIGSYVRRCQPELSGSTLLRPSSSRDMARGSTSEATIPYQRRTATRRGLRWPSQRYCRNAEHIFARRWLLYWQGWQPSTTAVLPGRHCLFLRRPNQIDNATFRRKNAFPFIFS